MNRKAQGATEYLIILAVVIIIGLIVVGAMGGIPGIGAAGKSRSSASYWATADVAIVSYAHAAAFVAPATTASLNVTIRNNQRGSIQLSNTAGDLTIGGFIITCAQYTLFPGQQTKCWYKNAIGCGGGVAGSAFSYDVSLKYTDPETKKVYTFTGDGQRLEGRCSST